MSKNDSYSLGSHEAVNTNIFNLSNTAQKKMNKLKKENKWTLRHTGKMLDLEV